VLDELRLYFVMDVHRDERVFLNELSFKVPQVKTGMGRKPTKYKADICSFRLDKLLEPILKDDWQLEDIRDTFKGKLRLHVFKKDVWIWDGESSNVKKGF